MAERTRIAREMHDVLAHRLSLLALHAGGLEVRSDLPPAEVRETAALLRSTARQALEELRGVIGVLRDESGQELAPPGPQPTLLDIRRLVDETRRAGGTVDLDLRVERADDLPGGLGRDAYRVVQESLTNIAKHADGQEARVRVTGAPGGGLHVSVRNSPAVPVRDQPDPARVWRRSARAGGTGDPGRWQPRPRPGRVGRLRGGSRVPLVSTRVLLVDDDALVRAGLRIILSSADDLEVVGEADDGVRAVAAVRVHRPDVVLMDIRMAEMDGITATAALRRLDPGAAGDRADHLPRGRAGDGRAPRGRERLPPQGHPARPDHQRRSGGRLGRRHHLPGGDPYAARPLRRRRGLRSTTCRGPAARPPSPTGNGRWRPPSAPAPRTPRSRARCT